ncbi:MAG: hypothetical protein Q9170_003543 [Blastenia crenularia]
MSRSGIWLTSSQDAPAPVERKRKAEVLGENSEDEIQQLETFTSKFKTQIIENKSLKSELQQERTEKESLKSELEESRAEIAELKNKMSVRMDRAKAKLNKKSVRLELANAEIKELRSQLTHSHGNIERALQSHTETFKALQEAKTSSQIPPASPASTDGEHSEDLLSDSSRVPDRFKWSWKLAIEKEEKPEPRVDLAALPNTGLFGNLRRP